MTEQSRDYHDYVFRSGKLLGDFEGMYRNSAEPPWHQQNVPLESDVQILKTIVGFGRHETILDVGCGLGYLANELSPYGHAYGLDISPTAIDRARTRFPHVQFAVANVAERQAPPFRQRFDLVVCRGLFWYVTPWIDAVVVNLSDWTKPGGHLLIHQNFPPLHSAFVGRDVLPNPEALRELFDPRVLALRLTNHLNSRPDKAMNDDWHTLLFQRLPVPGTR